MGHTWRICLGAASLASAPQVERHGPSAASVDCRALLSRPVFGRRVESVYRLTDAVQEQVDLVVRNVQVVDDALERRRCFDLVTYGQE